MKRKSKKQEKLDAELGLIIAEMRTAMRNANRTYVSAGGITINMEKALRKFQDFCTRNLE